MKVKLLIFVLLLIGSYSCRNNNSSVDTGSHKNANKYARRFSISEFRGNKLICLFGNRNNFDTTAKYLLYKEELPDIKGVKKIKIPCRNVAALSSIYAAMLCELGSIDQLKAIDNIDYVNQAEVIKKHAEGKLLELSKGPEPDVEQTIQMKPDIIFTFGMGDGSGAAEKKLEQAGQMLAVSVDHLEESPLARAEWIRFFGAFMDKERQADSIFLSVEKEYLRLRELAAGTKERPTVFSEVKFGDVWYMPGGRSYMAQLLADAGAWYLWKEDEKFGSLPLSFEQVYGKAKNADFWINLPLVRSKQELLSQDPRYGEFKAFKNDAVYNNTKVANSQGYSIYWESGMIHPERILADLIRIFHPERREGLPAEFYYYTPLR